MNKNNLMKNLKYKILVVLFLVSSLMLGIGTYAFAYEALLWGIPLAITGFYLSFMSVVLLLLFWIDKKNLI
ncbi:hypothetical protein [Halalkalibacter akibai]|uniref:DUF3955 domain-containing protein n=1 Tax=Halalkalibacter akibai (strain ATCC 43226 / DSM 21942 / CIP 109018 / JCM 9157 / 1139) TaxID=1236973 RepID=W4QT23_HALA3|nr:hypothetical protein [Halalkalibacter akibai]GAE35047.1 hypothetical protein JCM9157_2140 [Halalkalibacter akibai JCM 9157]